MKKLFFFLLLSFASESYAYIDPGTGTFLIQSLIALAVSVAFYIRHPLKFIQMIIQKFFKKKIEDQDKNH